MAYGMTYEEQTEFIQKLSDRLEVSEDRINEAINHITREKMIKVARNERIGYN